MTVRRLAEEILGLDLGAALAAASLAVRLGFARKGRGNGKKEKERGSSSPSSAHGGGGGTGATKGEEENPSSSSSSSIALVVDAAVTSSLMAGALSPGLKTHAVSLFEGGRVSGDGVVSDLLRELDATREVAERFGAEGGIAELAADAAALAVAIRALRESGGRGGAGGRAPPRVELLRREALESSLPRGAAARLLCSQYSAVVSVAPAAPLAIVAAGGGGAGGPGAAGSKGKSPPRDPGGRLPLFLGPRPWSTCSPLFSHLLLWAASGSGPARGAVALPSGLCLRKLPGALAGAPAVALWCWRGGEGSGGRIGLGEGEEERRGRGAQPVLSARPGVAPRAPRGLRASAALLGAGIAEAPFLLRELNGALASRGSLGGGVLAVPLPAAAGSGSLRRNAFSLSAPAAAAGPEELLSGFSLADVALPLPSSNSGSPSSSSLLEAVDPFTGEKVSLEAPPRWREAVKEMALSSCVGVVRFCRFPLSDGGEKQEEEPSSFWFPLGLRLGIPLSPRPTCDAVCGALAESDLMSSRGIERAKAEAEEREETFARFVKGEKCDSCSSGLLLLSRALVFDGEGLKPVSEASASTEKGKAVATATLGRRCLQAPGAVFAV